MPLYRQGRCRPSRAPRCPLFECRNAVIPCRCHSVAPSDIPDTFGSREDAVGGVACNTGDLRRRVSCACAQPLGLPGRLLAAARWPRSQTPRPSRSLGAARRDSISRRAPPQGLLGDERPALPSCAMVPLPSHAGAHYFLQAAVDGPARRGVIARDIALALRDRACGPRELPAPANAAAQRIRCAKPCKKIRPPVDRRQVCAHPSASKRQKIFAHHELPRTGCNAWRRPDVRPQGPVQVHSKEVRADETDQPLR